VKVFAREHKANKWWCQDLNTDQSDSRLCVQNTMLATLCERWGWGSWFLSLFPNSTLANDNCPLAAGLLDKGSEVDSSWGLDSQG
jgi:hypothetical protein